MTHDTALYLPKAALVVFTAEGNSHPYIEYYDMDGSGCPVNPHPLTVREAQSLAKALDTKEQSAKAFLRPEGLLPSYVLHIDPSQNGSVLWYTKPQRQTLYFTENLNLENSEIHLPTLVWKADKKHLRIFALKGKSKPNANSLLCHAPFFNLYQNGGVCMGNVDVRITSATTLEGFITAWQGYFFGSYFSHHIGGHHPLKENLISIYKELIETGGDFPTEKLNSINVKLKDLL